MRLDSAAALFRAATRADATFLPAFLEQLLVARLNGDPMTFRAEIAGREDLAAGQRRCLDAVAVLADGGDTSFVERFKALGRDNGATPCVSFGLAQALQLTSVVREAARPEELSAAREVARAFPEYAGAATLLAYSLDRVGRPEEAMAEAAAGINRSPHVVGRQHLQTVRATLLVQRGDSAGAGRVSDEIMAEARRDRRAWIVHSALLFRSTAAPADADRAAAELLRNARATSRPMEIDAVLSVASPLVQAGRMTEALSLVQPLIPYAERNGLTRYILRLRFLEGRALVRSGRAREAIVALEKSRAAALRIGSAQSLSEADHQLTHAHEGLSDWPRAAQAARRFVASAQLTFDPAIRVISWNDAAGVHRKAGWHASADSLSRLMVAAIERERLHYAFAAEYFERVGDLGRAMSYLRRASVPTAGGVVPDRKELFSGLTRLHLTMGNLDSAMEAAATHDSLRQAFDEILVPRVLVARGEPAKAVAAMRAWAALQAERGNVRGQVKAMVSLAEALAEAAPAEAVGVAGEAEDLAGRHGLVAEQATAARLRGESLHRVRAAGALESLDRARTLGVRHPDAMHSILTDVARGEVLARAGRHRDARSAFEGAVRRIERTGGSVGDDVMHARFRAARLRAFDGAMRTELATTSGPARSEALLRWSARKKSVDGDLARTGSAVLRARLAHGEALIDYVVVDTIIVAVVLTSASSTAHTLTASLDEVRALTGRLVRPISAVYGGRVDLARAPFDVAAARRLHQLLLAPFAARLAGMARLVIVPDAPLHAVPFDALVLGGSAEAPEFLLDRFAVSYATAPVARASAPRAVRTTDEMLLVVGDAPGAARERDALRAVWRRVVVLDGVRGTESAVRHGSAGGILHVASHARSSERDPLASFLALAPDSASDGLMHYAEVTSDRKAYRLVVLNACETSSGQLLAGSGFMSLARAFLIGGASSVVATHWPVGAASADLSATFYRELKGGRPATDALRAAKLELRRSPATAHPFYWASHQLVRGF